MFELTDIQLIRNQRTILQLEKLQLDSQAFTVILGHNGSGKSTLLNLLARQLSPDQGQISYQHKPLARLSQKQLAREIAFLPQRLPDVAGLTVRELVRLGRFPWRGTLGRWRSEDNELIESAMAQTGVSRWADQLADNLSGGERQRAWIAMLLAQQSPVLLLDEPTSALDPGHQYELMRLLQTLNRKQGRGVITILHDLNLALCFADQIIALNAGQLAFQGPVDQLDDPEQLAALYNIDITLIDHPHRDHKVAIL